MAANYLPQVMTGEYFQSSIRQIASALAVPRTISSWKLVRPALGKVFPRTLWPLLKTAAVIFFSFCRLEVAVGSILRSTFGTMRHESAVPCRFGMRKPDYAVPSNSAPVSDAKLPPN
jgi:hypothetical protein